MQLGERRPEEQPIERLEWDQDGQYYHYLTKWMHALNCVSQVKRDPTYIRWAIELAQTAHARFTCYSLAGGQKRMYWKMSIDLTYPLVSSMGQHDPLGVGGLLFDASRIAQLMIKGNLLHAGPDLLETVVQSALLGMKSFAKGGELEHPADYRLAFRELGLSIGLSAVSNQLQWIEENAPGRFLMI